nr:SlyX family protein [Gulbenkiania indica]
MSARDTRQRAEALEVRLAWLDDTLDSLSRTVARQQQEINLLQEQLRVLYRQLQQGPDQSGSPLSLRDEVPPHY